MPCRVTKVNNTTYECGYLPNTVGPHKVSVTYGGADIPKSPFPVMVGPYKSSRIRAFGPGLEGGVVGYPADFIVETNGETGSLGKNFVDLLSRFSVAIFSPILIQITLIRGYQ